VKRAVESRELRVESAKRLRAALQPFTHKTLRSWREAKRRFAILSDAELTQALEFERLGKRRTEHLKLIDIELRRRRGDVEDRKFKVEVGANSVRPGVRPGRAPLAPTGGDHASVFSETA
jgi:hypothetical protein